LLKKASAVGLRTLALPKEYGGSACDQLTLAIIVEELGAVDLGFASMIGQHTKYCDYLVNLCTEEQRSEWIPKLIKDATFLLAIGITEPDSGTDNQLPYDAPGAGMRTFAKRMGGEYIINGTKHFISNGGIAKLYFVYARTKEDVGITQGVSMFLVPHDTPGFSVARIHNKLGRRLLLNAELLFEDARVPAKYLVGEENKAWEMFYGQSPGINNTIACLVGAMRTCYEEALGYAKIRIQGGVPIIKHSIIGSKLTEMRIKVEASRALLWKNASSWDYKL
jgi:alkylation response protein AidB-like acyl-CoA dehydrogenase